MPSPPPTSPISPTERAAESFAAELSRWRVERGLTKKQLANQMGFDPSYVSHVEGRRHRPTEDFARRAEAVLRAGGAIWLRFQDYDDLRHARAGAQPQRDPPVPEQWMPPGTGLIVEREIATLSYLGDAYRCVIRRALYNAGTEPVTRYLVRVAVDRYPDDPERSNQHHRDHPLTFDELDLQAFCDDPPTREPMEWRKKHDRDAFKEVWLLFENSDGRFPLYPGERVAIEYAYTVGEEKWGRWFQRAVRLPTRRLTVRLDFPADLDAQVWGVETSLSSEEAPLRTPVVRHGEGDRTLFEWTTDAPTLNARYRLEWRFRSPSAPPEPPRFAASPTPLVKPAVPAGSAPTGSAQAADRGSWASQTAPAEPGPAEQAAPAEPGPAEQAARAEPDARLGQIVRVEPDPPVEQVARAEPGPWVGQGAGARLDARGGQARRAEPGPRVEQAGRAESGPRVERAGRAEPGSRVERAGRAESGPWVEQAARAEPDARPAPAVRVEPGRRAEQDARAEGRAASGPPDRMRGAAGATDQSGDAAALPEQASAARSPFGSVDASLSVGPGNGEDDGPREQVDPTSARRAVVPAQRRSTETPSELMRSVGVVQRGSALLAHPAVPLRLPADAPAGREVVERLLRALGRITEMHTFSKGMGLAAPQLGLSVAIAVVRPPDASAEPLVLVNPRVVDASPQTDEQYEGCLSFFDVRGLVPRPLRIEVEHADWSGVRRITTFEQGMARLVAHEIDHLEGHLYDERMAPGAPLVPVTEYRQTGKPWTY